MASIVLIWLAIDYLAADYFASLTEGYNVSPKQTHQMFLEAAHHFAV